MCKQMATKMNEGCSIIYITLTGLLGLNFCFGTKALQRLNFPQQQKTVEFTTHAIVPDKLKLQHSPPWVHPPGNLTLCCAWGAGNLIIKVFLGVGSLKTEWERWGNGLVNICQYLLSRRQIIVVV